MVQQIRQQQLEDEQEYELNDSKERTEDSEFRKAILYLIALDDVFTFKEICLIDEVGLDSMDDAYELN